MAKGKKKKKEQKFSKIVFVAAAAFLLVLCVLLVKKCVDVKGKEDIRDSLSVTLSQKESENQSIKDTINSDDIDEILEQNAREDGYADPNDHIYVNATPGS